MDRFYEWCENCSREDESFKYYAENVLFFGPLRGWFYDTIKYGNGISREACYMLILPMFAKLQKKNYFADTLVHLVNIVARWPVLTRLVVQRNSSVNIAGKTGHNIAFDEYMETFVVRSMKLYVSGKTTIEVLKAISSCIQLMSSVRNVYKGRSGFNVHSTSKHKVSYSLPDQLKVALFCMNQKMFKADQTRKKIKTIPCDAFGVEEGFVPNQRVDVYRKGKGKTMQNFDKRMYSLFPERREQFMAN